MPLASCDAAGSRTMTWLPGRPNVITPASLSSRTQPDERGPRALNGRRSLGPRPSVSSARSPDPDTDMWWVNFSNFWSGAVFKAKCHVPERRRAQDRLERAIRAVSMTSNKDI